MKKQRFISAVMAFVCALTITAANAAPVCMNASYYAKESDAVVHVEETKWYYRVNNGVLEKRLWSITQGRWLTDWEPACSSC